MDCIGVIFGRVVTRSVYATRSVASDWRESATTAPDGRADKLQASEVLRFSLSCEIEGEKGDGFYHAPTSDKGGQGGDELCETRLRMIDSSRRFLRSGVRLVTCSSFGYDDRDRSRPQVGSLDRRRVLSILQGREHH